jgi:hypothetical protein
MYCTREKGKAKVSYKALWPKRGKKAQRTLSLQAVKGVLLFSLALMHTKSNSSLSLLLRSDRLQDPLSKMMEFLIV